MFYLKHSRVIVVAAAGLFFAVSILTHAQSPLYDGIGFPDEPYRYIVQPSGPKATSPAANAQGQSAVVSGTNSVSIAPVSNEQGPQVQFYIPEKSLRLPNNLSSITITATPQAPSGSATDGKVAGNVYRVLADNAPSASFTAFNKRGLIALRLPQNYPPYPTMEYKPLGSSAWQKLATERRGNDIYQGALNGFGDYELVQLKQPVAQPKKSNSLIYAFAAAVLVLVVAYFVWRLKFVKKAKRGKH